MSLLAIVIAINYVVRQRFSPISMQRYIIIL